MPTTCAYCAITPHDEQCLSPRDDGTALCTRPRGHDGPHVACGHAGHERSTWGPTMADVARDLFQHAAEQNQAITRARDYLTACAHDPHGEHCTPRTPCPHDTAEEALARLNGRDAA
ncbi:hypothetical protein [Brachybacterium kimchii]|uniref:Uncharacterized protein n=1 Tax=Brachybacterium kimchii TaxID=2942909 RepID=A0ABY4NB77_9MICO|nr:hypothetical protein [Brachybacterium kimchii]UQN31797.1 hypothetical protein M4486_19600 [Brachybacterium kimchii]